LKIGIVGGGIVGSSLFRILSEKHQVKVLDPKVKTQFPTLIHSMLLKGMDVQLAFKSREIYDKYKIERYPFKSYTLGKVDSSILSLWENYGVSIRETEVNWIGEKAIEAQGGDSLVNIKQLTDIPKEQNKVKIELKENIARVFANGRELTREFDTFILSAGSWNSNIVIGEKIPLKPYYCWATVMKGPRQLDKFIVYDYVLGFYSRPLLGIGSPLFVAGDGDIIEMKPPEDGVLRRPEIKDMELVISRIRTRFTARMIYISGNMCEGTPDMKPVYGRIKDNLYIAAGLNGYGAEVGPGLALLTAQFIEKGEEVKEYLIDRFRGIRDFSLGKEPHEL
jgi:glycine/D-amino acid oxidase-like deaminating enzyme